MSLPPLRLELAPFSGPLEYLLLLVEMDAMASEELSLREMLDQYEAYYRKMEDPPLEAVADELLKLLYLAYRKSHDLLPFPEPLGEEEITLPGLEEKLKELSLYGLMGEILRLRPLWNWDRFPRGMKEPLPPPWIPLIPPQALLDALQRLYERNFHPPLPFSFQPRPTLEEELPPLLSLFEAKEEYTLEELLPPHLDRLRRVYRFLLLLELIRLEGLELKEEEGRLLLRRSENLTQELLLKLLPEAYGLYAD